MIINVVPETRAVIEGVLTKDKPYCWLDHYRLDGHWIKYWWEDNMPKFPEGAKIRITIEVVK